MKDNNKEKTCIICGHLLRKKEICPTAPIKYTCNAISKLINSPRFPILKLEQLNKFYCNFFKNK